MRVQMAPGTGCPGWWEWYQGEHVLDALLAAFDRGEEIGASPACVTDDHGVVLWPPADVED